MSDNIKVISLLDYASRDGVSDLIAESGPLETSLCHALDRCHLPHGLQEFAIKVVDTAGPLFESSADFCQFCDNSEIYKPENFFLALRKTKQLFYYCSNDVSTMIVSQFERVSNNDCILQEVRLKWKFRALSEKSAFHERRPILCVSADCAINYLNYRRIPGSPIEGQTSMHTVERQV